MTSGRRKVLPAGGETGVVYMKLFYLSVNDNRFVGGKRTKLWYIFSRKEPNHKIITLAVQDKRRLQIVEATHPSL